MEWLVPEWLVALAFTLFVIDIFLMTEFLSWGGVLSLATWVTWRINAPIKWAVLVFIAAFVAFAFLYVFLLRNTVGAIVRKIIQGKAPDESVLAIVGKTGVIRVIDDHCFVYVEGELWPLANGNDRYANGLSVKVASMENGEASVVPV